MYSKISELTEAQKEHLAWRIDKKTSIGYLSAIKIAKGELGDMTIDKVFERCNMNPRQAKIHARKVMNFNF